MAEPANRQLAREVLEGVVMHPGHETILNEANYHPALGFLAINGNPQRYAPGRRIMLVGFGVSGWQRGNDSVGEITPITRFGPLPLDMRTIDRQGKGVGPRLYNTPQALAGSAEDPEHIGVYKFSVDTGRVYDDRRWNDGLLTGQLRRGLAHKRLTRLAAKEGVWAAVARLHSQMGDPVIALYNQTPDGQRKKKARHAAASAIREQFAVVRYDGVRIDYVGDYHRPPR